MPGAKKLHPLPYNPLLRKRAQELRRAGILHEVLLWQQVKGRQLHGLNFDRQQIIGDYIVDFYCAERQTVIELDGSSHEGREEHDQERELFLTALGLHVIHIPAKDVLQRLTTVMEFLRNHPWLVKER